MSQFLAQAQPGNDFNILQSLQQGFTVLVSFLPQLLGALVVLLIGYIIAKLLNKAINKLLERTKIDEKLSSNQGGRYAQKVSPGGKPSRLVGLVVFWVIMIFVISSAVSILNIPALTNFMNLLLGYLPNVIAALLIFLVAAGVAGAVGALAHRTMGDTPTGKIVRGAVPALVMAIAVFMILTQLGIAPVIVTATYIALIGALALATALAFGLGGRDAAAQLVNSGYRKAQEQSDQVTQDIATGKQRAQSDAQHARRRAQQGDPYDSATQTMPYGQSAPAQTGSYRP